MDALSWVQSSLLLQPEGSPNLPAFLSLADEGYDVWMSNIRGTKYANVNPRYPKADGILHGEEYFEQNYEKYDFSFAEYGTLDLPPMLDKIREKNGNEKVTYIGYSQGTTSMFYALSSQEENFADKVDKAIMLGPAVYSKQESLDDYLKVFPVLRAEHVNAINRPYYWQNDVRHICNPSPDDFMANDRDLACKFSKALVGEATSTKGYEHMYQLTITQRFQEYVQDFNEANADGPLVSPGLSSIKQVPIQLVHGEKDINCTTSGVMRLKDELGQACILYTEVPDYTHYHFALDAASPKFLNLIREQIEFEIPQ